MIDSLGYIADAFNARLPLLDSITNNIANTHTPGFKAEKSYMKPGSSQTYADIPYTPVTVYDFSTGPLQRTGNPLDMAIQGEGFFTIETKSGEAYTRKGNFTINSANELVTPEGNFVLGDGGRIVLTGKQIAVSENGEIKTESGVIGKLRIVKFEKNGELIKEGAGLFRNPENKAVLKTQDEPDIKAEHLENSNVQVIKEMVEMIDVQRTVESYQKIIQTLGDFDRLSTNRLGRLT